MFLTRRLYVIATLIACCLQAQGADKYTDENRPYEFGFTIDGEQHRHEKKDENGLIMGEFGFITADGVYHVTVYATDENGNFKILSMKNIRVKPYPTAGERKGNSLPFPPSQPGSQAPPPPPSKPHGYQAQPFPPASTSIQRPIGPGPAAPNKTCSGCSIPATTTRRPPQPPTGIATPGGQFQLPNYNSPAQKYPKQNGSPIAPSGSNPQYPQGGAGVSPSFSGQPAEYPQPGAGGFPGQPAQDPQNGLGGPGQLAQYPQAGKGTSSGFPGQPSQLPQGAASPAGGPNYSRQPAQYPQNQAGGSPNYGSEPARFPAGGVGNPQLFSPQQGTPNTESRFGAPGDRTPKQYEPQYNDVQQPYAPIGSSKPMLISAQMSLVDKNTDIYKRGPGEKEGLPDGLTKNDMTTLLYTFNYTVGFHGHHEEGYINGAKKGYYYVTGRNGVRTRVDYEADENGFRPKITQEVLDLVSEEVPKPETEKDEKYGLKGYEFKWLYFPTDDTKRS